MRLILFALVKRRFVLKVYPSQKGVNSHPLKSISEGRDLVRKDIQIDHYEIVEETYIRFKKKDMILETTKIENGIRAELLMIEDVEEQIKYDDFFLTAQTEPTGTILRLRNGFLYSNPSSFSNIIIGNKIYNMLEMIQQKIAS